MKESIFNIYFIGIIISAILAGMAQKLGKKIDGKKKLNKFFWILSMLILTFIMAFRTLGVSQDDKVYETIFNGVIKKGLIGQFMGSKMEIGYLALNYVVSLFTNNFYACSFIATIIPIYCFYKAFEYEKDNINLFLGIFLFGTTMYIYFFGITRLFIAAGIIAYAYRYIFEKKTKKYVIFVLLASLFHYSALFMLFFIYFTTEKEQHPRSLRSVILIMFILMPVVIHMVDYILPNIASRYSRYTLNTNVKFDISMLDKLPFLIISLYFQKAIVKFNKNIRIYNVLYALTIVISIFSAFISLGRIQWYMTFSICIILPSIIRFLMHKYKELGYIATMLTILYGFLYGFRLIEGTILTEYSNIFFK